MLAYTYYSDGRYSGTVEDHGFLPNNATHEPVPDAREGYERFYIDGKWIYKEDHKGKEYWMSGDAWDASPRVMEDYGPLPEGHLLEAPEKPEEVRLQELQKKFTDAIQNRMDEFARTRGYDNMLSVCSYYGSPDTKFKNEALRAMALRTETWTRGYQLIDEIMNGTRPMPTTVEEIFAELPELTWE